MTGTNSKGELIARALTLGLDAPTFEAEPSGPPHARTFQVVVQVGGQVLGQGTGRTKREAERAAAEQALQQLNAPANTVVSGEPEAVAAEAWPIYAPVLAQSVEAALEFVGEDHTLADVRAAAAQFYRDLLADLGHGPQAQDA